VPVDACTASWRIRCRLFVSDDSALDAVWIIDTPSFAFDTP